MQNIRWYILSVFSLPITLSPNHTFSILSLLCPLKSIEDYWTQSKVFLLKICQLQQRKYFIDFT